MNPPQRGVDFRFDEEPGAGPGPHATIVADEEGGGATMTHDHKRHGTTDLFAAMSVATGHVLYDTKTRHSAKEVLDFFRFVDLHVAPELDIHVVLDNLSAHKSEQVAKWLAHPPRAR